jgi:hypothetical protein
MVMMGTPRTLQTTKDAATAKAESKTTNRHVNCRSGIIPLRPASSRSVEPSLHAKSEAGSGTDFLHCDFLEADARPAGAFKVKIRTLQKAKDAAPLKA